VNVLDRYVNVVEQLAAGRAHKYSTRAWACGCGSWWAQVWCGVVWCDAASSSG
jgi:hypothetical protein